nr:EF-hand domain-containing protein [uncultured Sphingomonas sp.]
MANRKKLLISAGGGVALLAAAAALAVGAPDGRHGHPGDLNGDGQITTAEIDQAARQRFTAFDVNNDGNLTGAELALANEGRGERKAGRHGGGRGERGPDRPQPAPAAAAAAAAAQPNQGVQPAQAPAAAPLRFDFDGNGAISFAEFRRGMATRYMLIDANRDGTVSAAELKAAPHGRGGWGGGRH